MPVFEPEIAKLPTTPSLKRLSGEADYVNMDTLIKEALRDDDAARNVVDRLAESIAAQRKITGRRHVLKRHETA